MYLLISWTIVVHLHGFITLMLSLLRLLNGISMTKSGKIKSKSDKLTKFFLDFADVVNDSQTRSSENWVILSVQGLLSGR